MSEQFVSVNGGDVNLRYVRMISYVRDRRTLRLDDGSQWTVPDYERLPEAAVVVPAPAPMTLVEVWYDPANDLEPEERWFVERAPIVAWRIEDQYGGGYPLPIAVGMPEGDYKHQFIELEGGFYRQVGYEGDRFTDLEAVKEFVKKSVEEERSAKTRR